MHTYPTRQEAIDADLILAIDALPFKLRPRAEYDLPAIASEAIIEHTTPDGQTVYSRVQGLDFEEIVGKNIIPKRMTPGELRDIRDRLGLSWSALADRLRVREDTARRWGRGREPIPYRVPSELLAITRDRLEDLETLHGTLADMILGR